MGFSERKGGGSRERKTRKEVDLEIWRKKALRKRLLGGGRRLRGRRKKSDGRCSRGRKKEGDMVW